MASRRTTNIRQALLAAALLPLAVRAADQATLPQVTITADRDAEWHGYRLAYRTAAFFAPFVAARPLIQVHMQIRPNRPELPMDGLRLHLTGEKTSIDIAVDGLGRATIPMLKQAYDEDAVLRLNRQKGNYHFAGRYSIREREDGVYRAADLRAACDQLLSAQRETGYRLRLMGLKCVGVKFIYPVGEDKPAIAFKRADGGEAPLPAAAGQPFENKTMGAYTIATYRFADWPAQGEVLARARPLGIGTLYE